MRVAKSGNSFANWNSLLPFLMKGWMLITRKVERTWTDPTSRKILQSEKEEDSQKLRQVIMMLPKTRKIIENLILFLFPKYRYSIYSTFSLKIVLHFLSPNSGVIVLEEAKNVIKKQKPLQSGPGVVGEVESHPSSSQSAVATGKENDKPLKTKKVNLGTSVAQVRYFVFQSLKTSFSMN
jgi:hypothetical protein